VKAAFARYTPQVRARLLHLRALIYEAAREADVGALTETLKWGQPAYLPTRQRIGTTVRIDALKDDNARYAAYFHCQTTLVGTFRSLYRDVFAFEAERALILRTEDEPPDAALKHCFALALTYHARGRAA